MTENLPKGWMIMKESRYAGADVRFVYVPYMYGTWVERKGLLRRKVLMEGWHPRGPEFKFEDEAIYYVEMTDKARKK